MSVNRLLDKLQALIRELIGDIGCLEETTGSLHQIASATEEQSTVMEEINRSVSELNSLTEENAAMAGSVVQTGNDLNELAQQLGGRVRQFRV